MKINLITASAISAISLSISAQAEPAANETKTQTATEKSDAAKQWHNLLEGNNLSQWKPWKKSSIDKVTAWTVKDGILHLSKSPENKSKGGSIITLKQYPNFELKFEFKINEAGNSGIKYRSLDNLGLEYQVLDDVAGKDNKNPLNSTASLYQLVAAPKTKKLNPVGEWNTGHIIANGNHLEHWLNGEKVVEIEMGSEEWKAAYAKSKYRVFPTFAKQSNEILLQDHGDEVSFRNLLIKELK
ncbi:MAG: 3-keto-disaccharide hydrolase [Akkermansiaceae bacterium]